MSVIIPAYQEEGRIGVTVGAISEALSQDPRRSFEVIVVDDGSHDQTTREAARAGVRVITLPRNRGKGVALTTGMRDALGQVLLLLDADTGASAAAAVTLLQPVLDGEVDMSVGVLPIPPGHKGGFGLVKGLARWGLRRAGAAPMRAPLSGQRALSRRAWERIGKLDPGFGIEMGLNLDAARLGLRVREIPVEMGHRLTGRSLSGFRHRGRQLRDVALAIARRWRWRS